MTTPFAAPKTVVFDVGNVLLQWDPENLYRKLIPDPEQRRWFLTEVCPPHWNLAQDRGRAWADAVAEATARWPDYADWIRAYDERWLETIGGVIEGSVTIMRALKAAGVPVYGITNFSDEKFALSEREFPFLTEFDDVVVSGREKVVKPNPRIYQILFERNGLNPRDCVFIDDAEQNVTMAALMGMDVIRFYDPAALAVALRARGLLSAAQPNVLLADAS